jgi:hypothetical protein
LRFHISKRTYIDKKTGKRKKTSTYSVTYDLPHEPGERRQQKMKSGFRRVYAQFLSRGRPRKGGLVHAIRGTPGELFGCEIAERTVRVNRVVVNAPLGGT